MPKWTRAPLVGESVIVPPSPGSTNVWGVCFTLAHSVIATVARVTPKQCHVQAPHGRKGVFKLAEAGVWVAAKNKNDLPWSNMHMLTPEIEREFERWCEFEKVWTHLFSTVGTSGGQDSHLNRLRRFLVNHASHRELADFVSAARSLTHVTCTLQANRKYMREGFFTLSAMPGKWELEGRVSDRHGDRLLVEVVDERPVLYSPSQVNELCKQLVSSAQAGDEQALTKLVYVMYSLGYEYAPSEEEHALFARKATSSQAQTG